MLWGGLTVCVSWGTATFQVKIAKFDQVSMIKMFVSFGLGLDGNETVARGNFLLNDPTASNMISMDVSIHWGVGGKNKKIK